MDDTFDQDALDHALRRGSLRELDTLGMLVSFDDMERAFRQHALLVDRGVETFTEQDMRQAIVNWVLAGRP